MRRFSEMNIAPVTTGFIGEKIKMKKILGILIIIHAFKIVPSKIEKGSGLCLHLQISINDVKHVVFSGSTTLMDTIKQVPQSEFPFATTIVEQNERHVFT